MHTVNPAASIFYYMGISKGSEAEQSMLSIGFDRLGDPQFEEGGAKIYYDPLKATDPLKVPSVWTGRFAEALGHSRGSPVSRSALICGWFGINPNDGATPLKEGGPTINQQVKASQRLADLQEILGKHESMLSKRRAKLYKDGVAESDILNDGVVQAATVQLTMAKDAVRSARADPHFRQTAHDQTFSAPKSVSLLWARLKADGHTGDVPAAKQAALIEGAMRESVMAVLDNFVEPQLLFIRKRLKGSAVDYDNVKGIASALFMHFDARPTPAEGENHDHAAINLPDPNMHIHALLMHACLGNDDEIHPVWSNFLSDYSEVIGAAFRGELASRLETLGIEVCADRQENIVAFDLAGITPAQKLEFSSRTKQVKNNLDKGMSRADATLRGRQVKGEYTGADLLASWGSRMSALGMTAETIKSGRVEDVANSRADQSMQKLQGRLKEGSEAWIIRRNDEFERAMAELRPKCPTVDEAIAHLTAKNPSITLIDISRFAMEMSQFCHAWLTPGQSPMQWAESFKSDILRSPSLSIVDGQDKFGRPTFTSNELLAREYDFYQDTVSRLLLPRHPSSVISSQDAEAAIANFEASESTLRGCPFALKGFQRDIALSISMCKDSIVLVSAPAGTGKTTAALGAVLAFEDAGCRTFCLAPSNSAAQNLAKGLRKSPDEGITPQSLVNRIARGQVSLSSSDVLFVDEASMLDLASADALFKAAAGAEGGPCRVVLIGDTEQLLSVGHGNVFPKLFGDARFSSGAPSKCNITSAVDSIAQWDRITRQNDDLGKQATTYFALGHNARALEIFERMGALSRFTTRDEAQRRMARDAMSCSVEASAALSHRKSMLPDDHQAFASMIENARAALRSAKKGNAKKSTIIGSRAIVDSLPPESRARARQWFADEQQIKSALMRVSETCRESVMIATKNSDVSALNSLARQTLKAVGALGGVDGKQVVRVRRGRVGLMEIAEGERIVFREKALETATANQSAGKRRKAAGIAKSQFATVQAVWHNGKDEPMMRVLVDGSSDPIDINAAHYGEVSYSYAITAHLSQGLSFSRIYEYLSNFAASQTDYVGKSRFVEGHSSYAVESEYQQYKLRAARPIDKTEARDIPLAQSIHARMMESNPIVADHGNASASNALRSILESQYAKLGDLRGDLASCKTGAIIQGKLLDFGAAPFEHATGAKPSYFATVLVGKDVRTVWGAGLRDAIEALGANAGDYIGLERLRSSSAEGAPLWRAHAKGDLHAMHALHSDDHIEEAAAQWQGGNLVNGVSFSDAFNAAMLSESEAQAIAASTIRDIKAIQGMRIQEEAWLAERDKIVPMPDDYDARIADALAAIPYGETRAAKIQAYRTRLSPGISQKVHAQPMSNEGRQWIAFDDKLAYCLTQWGSIESWSREKLPNGMLQTAIASGRHIDALLVRRQSILDQAKSRIATPVENSFGAIAAKLSVAVVDHPTHGLSLSISASRPGSHRDDPELQRLFVGGAFYGDKVENRRGGIGGLGLSLGFDDQYGGWLFKIECDSKGVPLPIDAQPPAKQLVQLATKLGYAPTEKLNQGRDAAWAAIKSRLLSPWGLCYAAECQIIGGTALPPKLLVSRTLSQGAGDIVRWNGATPEQGTVHEWEMCARASTAEDGDSKPARILKGVVLHDDGESVYLLRGDRILAIERAHVASPAETDLTGFILAVRFSNEAPPTRVSLSKGPVMEVVDQYIQDADRMKVPDLPLTAEHHWARKKAMETSSAGLDSPLPEHALAHAYAIHEGTALQARKRLLAEGVGEVADQAKLIELIDSDEPGHASLASATVFACGEKAIILKTEHGNFIAPAVDLNSSLAATYKGRIPTLKKSMKLSGIRLEEDANGRLRIVSAHVQTHRSGPINDGESPAR
jgi:hypothetical protein